MSFQDMKEMPHVLKPAILLLTLLQIIFMASPGLRAWGWFVCLVSILEFLTAIAVFLAFFFDIGFIQSSQYPLIELVYSAIFCVCSALCTVYYFCNMFYLYFDLWFLLAVAASVFLVLAYGLQALVGWTSRGQSSHSSSQNQASAMPPPGGASFPAGVNPA